MVFQRSLVIEIVDVPTAHSVQEERFKTVLDRCERLLESLRCDPEYFTVKISYWYSLSILSSGGSVLAQWEKWVVVFSVYKTKPLSFPHQ